MATAFDPFSSNIDPSALTALQRLDVSGPQYESYTVGAGQDGEMTLYRPVNNLPASYGALYNGTGGDTGADPTPSGYFSTNEVVNGVPVTAYYDAQGNVTKYVANTPAKALSGTERLSAEWDPTGKATPVQWSVDNGLFNSGITFGDATKAAILAMTAAGTLGGPTPTGAEAAGAADASFIAADASQLAAQGLSQAAIEQNLIAAGVDSFLAADAAQLALQGIGPNQMAGLLTQSAGGTSMFVPSSLAGATGAGTTGAAASGAGVASGAGAGAGTVASTGLTASQLANLAKAGLTVGGLLGGTKAITGLTSGGAGTLAGLPAQDRSGVSSGTANYSPEYYQAIQAKYNQMMPQQPRDVTTDLKNWYETKYAPKVTQ